ncbi:4Fe-4S ferredoxin [Hydrogenobaculum acidophilum]
MKIEVNLDTCIGCKMCMLVCSLKKVGGFNPTYSNIQINLDIGRKALSYKLEDDCGICDSICEEFCITKSIKVLS